MNIDQIIESLRLEPLPQEGGYFRRLWEHHEQVTLADGRTRPLASSIYYLMTTVHFSALHRLNAEETFFHHGGDGVEMLQLAPDGTSQWLKLGPNLSAGEQPRAHVAAGIWQGSRIKPGGTYGYALLSTVVAPGFVWEDFELGDRAELTAAYPNNADDVTALTY